MSAPRHISRWTGGKLYGMDLRDTLSGDNQLALTVPPTCYHFRGWTTFPLSNANSGGALRIRHMCTNAFIYPCVSYDAGAAAFTNQSGDEYVARLDTYSPTMGHETSAVGGGGSFFVAGTTKRLCPGDGTTDIPDEWPWHDVCNECWNFSECFWFESVAANSPDGTLANIGAGILALMQDSDTDRTKRRTEGPYSAFPWSCFSCHVAPNALFSLAYVAEVYRSQDKTSLAYGSVVNVWVDGYASVRIPLKKCT